MPTTRGLFGEEEEEEGVLLPVVGGGGGGGVGVDGDEVRGARVGNGGVGDDAATADAFDDCRDLRALGDCGGGGGGEQNDDSRLTLLGGRDFGEDLVGVVASDVDCNEAVLLLLLLLIGLVLALDAAAPACACAGGFRLTMSGGGGGLDWSERKRRGELMRWL
jgi:hypothetical protein